MERFSRSRWAGLIGESKRQAYIKKGAELHAVYFNGHMSNVIMKTSF